MMGIGISHGFDMLESDCGGVDSICVLVRPPAPPIDPGIPLYLMSGVATSENGLEWGDGWTAFQPINTGLPPDEYTSNCTVNEGNGECCAAR